jgi:hypothetical protein
MVLAVALLALAACQKPDVGQPCTVAWGDTWVSDPLMPPPPDPVQLHASGGADYFESGNLTCENLVCIVSPAPSGSRYSSGGYCSKSCVSNQDCFESETGLVCRQMVLDPVFLAQLSPELRDRYAPEFQASSFCAAP